MVVFITSSRNNAKISDIVVSPSPIPICIGYRLAGWISLSWDLGLQKAIMDRILLCTN